MSDKVKSVFFYGLFMDMALLQKQGLTVSDLRVAEVKGFKLQIGKRASMTPDQDETVWGVVATMAPDDLEKLYSEPSVVDYRPVTMTARFIDGSEMATSSYILTGGNDEIPNRDYAVKLAALAFQLNLPSHYIKTIEAFTK